MDRSRPSRRFPWTTPLGHLLLWVTAVVALTASGSGSPAGDTPEAGVTFEWFEYRGDDEIFSEPLAEGTYQNPIVAGFYPDPSIARVDDTFYMVHSSFAYSPGVPILRSTDLVTWQPLGHVLTRPSQLRVARAAVSRGIFAPTLRYHDGVFYMITTGVDDAGGNFIVTARDPAGEWSDPYHLPEVDGIDPSLFFDDDGSVYLTHNGPPRGEPLYEGHRAIWLWDFDLERMGVVEGSGRIIVDGGVDISEQPIWIEAPHLYERNGWYYLLCAEGGTGPMHSEVVFRTRSLDEPFVPWNENPILTQRDLDPDRPDPVATAGHADLVRVRDDEWWAVFLATRNYDRELFNTGRETFLLPVTWEDGWPRILERDAPVPYRPPKPAGLPPTAGATPLTGNFTWRDDFSGPSLGPLWNRLRTGDEDWLALRPGGGLTLRPLPVGLADDRQPAFVGRRQQHQSFWATTRVDLPIPVGVTAGLAAFQSELHHYLLAVRRTDHGHELVLERADGTRPEVIRSHPVVAEDGDLVLEIEGDRGSISFYYRTIADGRVDDDEATGAGRRAMATDLDARILSTPRAGGFVGVHLALHARRDPE